MAHTDDFQRLAHDIARQVAAYNPQYLSKDDLPEDDDDTSEEQVLLLQPYISDESVTIGDLVQQAIAKTGENIRICRFSRFQIGE